MTDIKPRNHIYHISNPQSEGVFVVAPDVPSAYARFLESRVVKQLGPAVSVQIVALNQHVLWPNEDDPRIISQS
jgi:hypothetical protein